jgi:hypothetical protein
MKNQHQRRISYLFYSVIHDLPSNTRNLPQISWEKEWWGEGGATFYSRLLDKYLKDEFQISRASYCLVVLSSLPAYGGIFLQLAKCRQAPPASQHMQNNYLPFLSLSLSPLYQ